MIVMETLNDEENCGDLSSIKQDIVLKAAICFEFILNSLLGIGGIQTIKTRLDNAKKKNISKFVQIAKSIGFKIQPGDALPDCLVEINPEKIYDSSRKKKGTISSVTLALLLIAFDITGHPFAELARYHPDLLLDIAMIVEYRGHGNDRNELSFDKFKNISETVYNFGKAYIKVMA